VKQILLAMGLASMLILPGFADPTPAGAKKTNTIFDYKKDLDLTDSQEAKMKEALKELSSSVTAGRSKISALEAEYRKLLESEPSIEKARQKLQQIANAQVELRVVDLQTSRKITGTLKPEQLKKWREIQVKMRSGAK
jgi:Spy/CpxP family protein refolding chaperone